MQITLGGKKLNANLDARGKHVQIARVKLNQKERLEPLSLVQVLGHLDQHIDGILACSPCNNVQGLLSPHTIIDDSTKVPVLLRNMSTKPIKLQKNVVVGTVSEVDQISHGGRLQTTSQVDESFHINLPKPYSGPCREINKKTQPQNKAFVLKSSSWISKTYTLKETLT